MKLIGFADTKASILLTVNGVILALLLTSTSNVITNLSLLSRSISLLMFAVSAVFGLLALWPRRTKDIPGTAISHRSIVKVNYKAYANDFGKFEKERILEEYLWETSALSRFVSGQFRFLQLSILSTIVALAILLLVITFTLSIPIPIHSLYLYLFLKSLLIIFRINLP